MKIAFATIGDAKDIQRGSGTPYYLTRELQRQGCEVIFVGPLEIEIPFLTRLFKYISRKMGKKYFSYRDPFVGRRLGREVENRLKNVEFDILLTNDYCIAGYTDIGKTVILYTDAYFPYVYEDNFHPSLANLSYFGRVFCQQTTKKGLMNASKGFFASDAALQEAYTYLPNTADKFSVIPYGANMETPSGKDTVESVGHLQSKGMVDLLFVGKDWFRKGGDEAVAITRLLNERGIEAQLYVVGVDLSDEITDEYVRFYGLLNKEKDEDFALLKSLYEMCDILLVPSKAEGYGLVFVEAAAYGVPSLAYSTSGVKTAVRDGESGVLLDTDLDALAFVNEIEKLFADPNYYQKLSQGAEKFFRETGNWESAVRRLLKAIKGYIYE